VGDGGSCAPRRAPGNHRRVDIERQRVIDRGARRRIFAVMTTKHLHREPDHEPGEPYLGSQKEGPVARPEGEDQPAPKMEDEDEPDRRG
jgi:hypothetical protein